MILHGSGMVKIMLPPGKTVKNGCFTVRTCEEGGYPPLPFLVSSHVPEATRPSFQKLCERLPPKLTLP